MAGTAGFDPVVDFAPNLNGATISLLPGPTFGQIQFSKNLTIDASMLSSGVTIQAYDPTPFDVNHRADGFRIFDITGGASTLVTLKNLNLTGGDVRSESGGAIRSYASLTLEHCSISDNYASNNGGGLYFDGGSGTALTLKSTSIADNTCLGNGGGLYVDASLATFTIENSTISGNTAGGGGIVVFGYQGTISIKNTAIVDNHAQSSLTYAAGLRIHAVNVPEVELSNVLVKNNEAVDGIGGVYITNSNSQVTITDCAISDNTGGSSTAPEVGGGLHIHGLDSSTTTIQNTTISGNKLLLPTGSRSAGQFSDYMSGSGMDLEVESGSTVVVRNSTISGNQAAGSGAGVQLGAYLKGGHVSFEHSTITENHADMDDNASGSGGGIVFEPGTTTTVTLDHTIVAGNFKGSGTAESDDIDEDIAGTVTASWSLVGDNFGTSLAEAQTPDGNGNLIGSSSPGGGGVIDPMLGPLVYNGGPVFLDGSRMLTHALLWDSPAINKGDPLIAFSSMEFDQRGDPWYRVDQGINARIDIGAIEWQLKMPFGDYNFNGVIDSADYTVWRDTLGSTTDLRADGNQNHVIDTDDYAIWKGNFGQVIADFNHSGATDIADYFLWQSTYGSTTDLRADANEDGIVDDADYQIWFDTYGSTMEIAQFGLLSDMFDPDAPPAVVGVTLGLTSVQAIDFADKVGSGEQIRSVPLIAANTVNITFSRDVNIAYTDLQIVNLDGSAPSIFDFDYDPVSQTATWTFNSSLSDGRYLIRLSDAIEDATGKALDGEFFNPTQLSDTGTSVFPSGDGDEGGEFRFRFTVLSGDSDHDNIDGTTDYTNWQSTEPGMIIVSTTTDDWDGNLSFGDVSLREAVNYANTAGTATAIQLPAGRYELTRTGTESTAGWEKGTFYFSSKVECPLFRSFSDRTTQRFGYSSRATARPPQRNCSSSSSPYSQAITTKTEVSAIRAPGATCSSPPMVTGTAWPASKVTRTSFSMPSTPTRPFSSPGASAVIITTMRSSMRPRCLATT